MNEKNGAPEWLWFLISLVFFFLMIAIFSKIQKNEKFADLRKNKKFGDPNYSVLFFAIFRNKEDPLRKSGILFSKIALLFQILFVFFSALAAIFIEKIFF